MRPPGLAHLAGLNMLGNHVDLLDDDFTLSRANSNNFAASRPWIYR